MHLVRHMRGTASELGLISPIVFRMVLIASRLFFLWRRGRSPENSGGDSKKMFNKKRNTFYGIWYFKKTTYCSKRFVLSLRQIITRKSHNCGGKTLTRRAQKIK